MREETESLKETLPRSPSVRLFVPGSEVGRRYEIRSVLGTGGSASVYAAWDRDLKRLVALKALRHDRMTEAALKRFRREVAVARDADSPRLVRVYDVGEAGETVFLTMELVDGESLRARLGGEPLEVREALRVAREILLALGDLHRLGIVHRDVKPGNILLGRDGVVKLADFGLARHWDGGDTRATETEGLVGTMEYLAPEQALGKAVDARTDLYAFGVVLYEMISGRVPFASESVLGNVVARLRERAPDVREARPGVPAWLAGVVAKLLARDPASRYGSAEEVLADLEAERTPGRTWIRRRRRRVLVAAAASTAICVAGAWLARDLLPGAHRAAPRLLTDGTWGIRALDDSGRVLWSRPDVRGAETATVVRTDRGETFRIAAVLAKAYVAPANGEVKELTFLDARSGRAIESRRLVGGAGLFPGFSDRYDAVHVTAVDVDGDGDDEVVVVFTHTPYFPSYAVFIEPRTGSSRVLIASSGHLRLRGAFDLDGDGRRELVFDGPNNRMGWMSGVAAVRVRPIDETGAGRAAGSVPGPAFSPDALRAGTDMANLLWYALGPTARHRPGDAASFDPVSRLLTLRTESSNRVLTADGFDPGGTFPISPAERQGCRDRAYALLRDAVQREETGFPADALPLSRRAVTEARAAGDEPLLEWARRVSGRIAILAGRTTEGERELSALLASSEAAPDIAYELARALHLAGETAKSARWYGWGLSRVRDQKSGRLPYEYLQGQLFALVETERWRDAGEAITRYESAFPGPPYSTIFRAFLSWRRGGRPERLPDEARHGDDFCRYWSLEVRLASGDSLDQVSRDLESERAAASDTTALLQSLSSEIEARRGNLEAALALATTAWSEVRAACVRQPWARAHAPLVAERLARLAGKAGRTDLVREARATGR